MTKIEENSIIFNKNILFRIGDKVSWQRINSDFKEFGIIKNLFYQYTEGDPKRKYEFAEILCVNQKLISLYLGAIQKEI